MISINWILKGYYRFIFPNLQIKNNSLWFIVHMTLMSLTAMLTASAFLFALAGKGWKWTALPDEDASSKITFSHSIIGIFTISLTLLQVKKI
jgi:hypothetical protein